MAELLKNEPTGRLKLYNGVEDDGEVNADSAIFTWDWISKATKIKSKKRFVTHLEAGHFGPHELVAEDNYRLIEGHRAISRFNNGRYKDQPVTVYTRDQYDDISSGKEMREMPILVGGKIMTKQPNLKKYNENEFIATRRYTPAQANILAVDRVNLEVDQKMVGWCDLPKRSDEYKEHFHQRWRFYNNLYLSEMALVARDTASKEDLLAAADLPASILCLINDKLSISQASTYISRWLAFQVIYDEKDMENPILTFRLHQLILEEILIDHYRDLQRLYGDVIDKTTQEALRDAMKRYQELIPADLKGPKVAPPSTNGKAEKEDEPVRTAPAKSSPNNETPFETQ